MTPERLVEALAALPSNGMVRLACVGARLEDGRGLMATLRLMIFDDAGIRDIKEQDVFFVRRELVDDDERVGAYCAAWCSVLQRAMAAGGVERFETLMPHDLVHPRVLELKKAHSEEDFVRAFEAKSRLGKLLG